MLTLSLALALLPGLLPVSVCAISPLDKASPCAKVSGVVQATGRSDGIPGHLAQDCLRSIPFYSEESLQLGRELQRYLPFQSTLDELLDPPVTYMSRSVSLDKLLLDILQAASNNLYASQADFDLALSEALASARDGHLFYRSCSLGIFDFYQDLSLVSVSEDGVQTPKVYTYTDLMMLRDGVEYVSNIIRIGGKLILEYINDIPGFHDPDARYNTLFTTSAHNLTQRSSFKPSHDRYPGANVTVQYANGSFHEVPTFAALGPAFTWRSDTSFNNGTQLFESLCLRQAVQLTAGSRQSKLTQVPMSLGPAPGSANQADDEWLSGHFSSLHINSDLAVLAIPAFEVSHTSSMDIDNKRRHFLATAQAFIQQAHEAGKTKLIIDLSDNVSDSDILAHGLYRLLFPGPNEPVYSSTRFRKHAAIALIGRAISNSHAPFESCTVAPFSAVCASAAISPDQTTGINTWRTLYGTALHFSTAHAAANFSDEFQTYLPPTLPPAPFAPGNITIVTNGICASACATFVALLRNHANPAHRVRSIALGGRSKHGPMQVVGGSKGAHPLSFADIDALVAGARAAVDAGTSGLTKREAQELASMDARIPSGLDTLALRILGGGVGFKSAYDVSSSVRNGKQFPRHFLYEAADCRLFYTPEMLLEPMRLWERVAWSAWGGPDGKMRDCVLGSMGAPGSLEAGGVADLEERYMTTNVRDGH